MSLSWTSPTNLTNQNGKTESWIPRCKKGETILAMKRGHPLSDLPGSMFEHHSYP
jgi:hypothetical protein